MPKTCETDFHIKNEEETVLLAVWNFFGWLSDVSEQEKESAYQSLKNWKEHSDDRNPLINSLLNCLGKKSQVLDSEISKFRQKIQNIVVQIRLTDSVKNDRDIPQIIDSVLEHVCAIICTSSEDSAQ